MYTGMNKFGLGLAMQANQAPLITVDRGTGDSYVNNNHKDFVSSAMNSNTRDILSNAFSDLMDTKSWLTTTAKSFLESKVNKALETFGDVKDTLSNAFTNVSDKLSSSVDGNDPYSYADYVYGLEKQAAIDQHEREQTSANLAMQHESNEAKLLRDWQEMMSNTAYQRSTEDLKKAGLNPILALGNAATTPSGASGSGFAAASAKANMNTGSNVALSLRELGVNSAVKLISSGLNAISSIIGSSAKGGFYG